MGYIWTNITAGATRIKGQHLQEVVDNVKNAETQLELTAPEKHTWSAGMDSFNKIPILHDEWQELRDATDNLDDKNYCRTHDVTHYVGYDADLHSTYCPTHYPDYCNDLHIGHHGSHLIYYFSGYNYDYHGTHKTAYYTSKDSVVHHGH